MLNWIAVWVGVYLFGLNGPLQNTDPQQQSVPVSSDVASQREAAGVLGRPGAAGPPHRALHRPRRGRRLLGPRQPLEDRLRGARGGPQPGGGALRRHQRRAQLRPRHGRLRGLRRARRRRWTSSAGSSTSPPTTSSSPRSAASASSASPSRCSGATRPAARWPPRCCSARCSAARRSATSTRRSSSPSWPSNLTLIIQGLVVLIVSADVIVLTMLRRGRGIFQASPARGTGPGAEAEAVMSTAVATAAPSARRAAAPRGLGRHRAGLRRLVHRPAAGARADARAVDPHRPAGDGRRRVGDRRRREAPRVGRGRRRPRRRRGRGGGHAVGRRQPQGRRHVVGAHRRHAALRDAADLRGAGRDHVRAQRRGEHRASRA